MEKYKKINIVVGIVLVGWLIYYLSRFVDLVTGYTGVDTASQNREHYFLLIGLIVLILLFVYSYYLRKKNK